MYIMLAAQKLHLTQAYCGADHAKVSYSGIYLTTDGDMVATDGAQLARTTCEALRDLPENVCVRLDSLVPKLADKCVIDTEKMIVNCFRGSRLMKEISYTTINQVDYPFPKNWKQLGMADPQKPMDQTKPFAMNVDFLGRLEVLGRGSKYNAIQVDRIDQITVKVTSTECNWPEGTYVIVMLVKL